MNILVAEDFDDTRLMIKTLLERKGHRVFEAGNGQEAVEIATREHPDLILMDLNMPIMDGLDVASRLRADPCTCEVPIVAVTAYCGGDCGVWRERALRAGCN